ncbi:MAG: hypothetical protein IPH88_09860 [Bacteroidales bacterium]|nr:hypothetical protein [Bacteroidales bacterium]
MKLPVLTKMDLGCLSSKGVLSHFTGRLMILVIILFSTCFFTPSDLLAQPSVLYSNITSATPASTNNRWTLNTISIFRQFRFQANQAGNFTWAFSLGTPATPDYSKNWRPFTTSNVMSYNTFIPVGWANGARYNTFPGGADGEINAVQNGYYYTFNVGINASADNVMEVLETSYNPTVISSCTSNWGTYGQRTVNIVLASAPQSGENVFLRYTTGGINFPTSNYVHVNMTGNTGSAIIPAQASGSTVHYYAYTSNKSKATIDADIASYGQPSHDMATLNISGVPASYLMPASPVIVTSTLGSQANIATGYATLQAAFTAINGAALHLGSISIAIMGNTTEVATATLNQVAGVTSVGIQPAGGAARTISGNFAGPIIDLNGADFVTIDGREGGTGTTKALTITNTNGGSGYAIRFVQDALNNTVRYCDLVASPTGVGIVTFSTASALASGVGNDFNSINTCNLYGLAGSNPVYGVYSSGSGSPKENGADTIANCNIYNFRAGSGTPAGVFLSGANSAWTIDGNSFYQTAAYAGPGNMVIHGIHINSSTFNGFSVKNNYIGGSAPQCGGTAWTINGFAQPYQFNGIKISCGTGSNNLEGNTIKNFNWLTSSAATAPGAWTGIYSMGSGNLNIGTASQGNTIGDNSTNSINITLNTNSGGSFYGIFNESTGTVNTQYNTIGSMTSNGSTAAISASLVAIYAARGTNNISNNTIGGSTTNSMNCNNSSTNATSQFIKGIVINPSVVMTSAQIINNNTISNLNNNYASTTTAATNRGITIEPATASNLNGSVTINGNIINNIYTSQNAAGAGISNNIAGIFMGGTSCSAVTIQGNTISALKATGGTAAVTVAGILYNGPSGASTISKNLIFGLETTNSTSTSAAIYGIRTVAGTATYSNNLISLGSTTGRGQINGFYDGGGASNSIYHNTVSITGTSVVNTTNSALNTITTNVRNIRNNIFYCTRNGSGTNRAVTISSTTGLTIGYNDYFGTLSGIALNVAPDNNSLAINPLFPLSTGTAPTDFIPAATTLNGAPISSITPAINDDIDEIGIRCVPTMGAQEYRISPTSVTATASPNPICTGNTLTLTGTATGATSYSWSGPNGFSPTTLSGSIANVTTLAAGVYTLTATNSCGSTAASTASVVVNSTPSMTTTPTTYNICSGDALNIPLTATSGSISWSAANNANVGGETTAITNTSLINDVLTNTTGSVQTVVYTATASTGSCTSSGQTISVSINPAVNISFDQGSDQNTESITICGAIGGGGQNDIDIWSGNLAGATYVWQYSSISNTGPWTTAPGTGNQLNISSFASTPGNHYFRLLLTANGITCTSDVVTLTVTGAAPTSPTGTGASRCGTGTVVLTASGCTGTLNWYDVPFGGTSLGTGASFTTPSISSTTTYYVSCTSGTCESPRTAVVATVQSPSPVSVIISTAATTICAGVSTTFTATGINGGATPGYQWQVNGGNVGTNSNSYTTTTLVNGDIVTCIITSSDPCTSGSPATSNSISMTVNPAQAVSVSISASSTSICTGTNVTFTATPTNGGSAPVYQWKLNGGNVGSNSTTYSNSTLANGDIITCVLTSDISCATGNPATSNSITMTVSATVGTPVFTLGASSSRCQGAGTVTYSATASNASSIVYSLDATSLGAGNTINAATGEVSYVAGWVGASTITATASGCATTATSNHIATTTATVQAPVFALGATSTRCQGAGSVTYSSTAANSTAITYSLDAISLAGSVSIDINTGTVIYPGAWFGTTTITATATGCNGPVTSTHVVTINPNVGFPVFTLGATSTRCKAAAVVSYAATASNSTGITYQLDAVSLGAGNTINGATGDVTYTAAWTGVSTITARAFGCNGPKTSSHTATTNPLVDIPVFGLGSSSTRCQGVGTVTYSATVNNATTVTYTLDAASLAGGNTINAATGLVTYIGTWSGTTVITVTATGCAGPTSATHTVTVTPNVTNPVFILGSTSTRCQAAGTVTYTATASNTTGITYLLDAISLGAGNTINASTGMVTYVAGWTGTSIITARAVGCNGPKNSTHSATTNSTPATSVIYHP